MDRRPSSPLLPENGGNATMRYTGFVMMPAPPAAVLLVSPRLRCALHGVEPTLQIVCKENLSLPAWKVVSKVAGRYAVQGAVSF